MNLRDLTEALKAKIDAGHPEAGEIGDQLTILNRLEDQLRVEPADELDRLDQRIAAHERDRLRQVLEQWLAVIERRDRFAAMGDRPRLSVSEFGAVGDGRHDDGPALRRAFEALGRAGAGAVLHLPAGRYRVAGLEDGRRRYALVLRGLEDVTIEAEPGTRLVAEPVGGVLLLVDCRNVTIRGLDLAHDPHPCTQGVVLAPPEVDDETHFDVDWRLDPGHSPPDAEPFARLTTLGAGLYDKQTAEPITVHAGLRITAVEPLDEAGRYRLRCEADGPQPRQALTAGARLGIRSRNLPGGRCALWVEDCAFCVFEDFEVRDSYHFAVLATHTTGCVFRGIEIGGGVEPDGSPRLCSVNADGFHAKSNRHGPRIERCTVLKTPDDCANLYARCASAAARLDPTTLLLDAVWDDDDRWEGPFADGGPASDKWGWRPDRRAFRPGDLLMLIDPTTGRADLLAHVLDLAPHAWRGRRAVAVQLDSPLPTNLRTRRGLGFDEPVPSSHHFLHHHRDRPDTLIEHFVVNLSAKSDGFVMRRNHLGRNTVAGVKMKASNGLIIDNRFERHGWCCVSLLMQLKWQEAFAPRNLLIQGNVFDNRFGVNANCGYPVPVAPDQRPAWISRIDLHDNRFHPGADGWAVRTADVRRSRFDA